MRVAITGANGLLGSALSGALRADGHEVTAITRSRAVARAAGVVHWKPAAGVIDAEGLEDHDVVVHLAGEPLFGVWTEAKKVRIRDSRVAGTSLLSRTLAGLRRPPSVLVSASGAGYYGERGEEEVDERATAGTGFLARVCVEWERAADPAREAGIRVAHLRSGVVLSEHGGALKLMLPIFRLGIGGRIGSGRQPFPWITLEDHVRATQHVIAHGDISGGVNMVAPGRVDFRGFVGALGDALGRPTLFAVPAALARLVMGEMAEEMLLSGTWVVPGRLQETGFVFRQPEIGSALRSLLR